MTTQAAINDGQEKLAEEINNFPHVNAVSLRGNTDLTRLFRSQYLSPLKKSELGDVCYEIASRCLDLMTGAKHLRPSHDKQTPWVYKATLNGQDICDMCRYANNERKENACDEETLVKVQIELLSQLNQSHPRAYLAGLSRKNPELRR